MPDQKISDLTLVSAAAYTDEAPLNSGGANFAQTNQQVHELFSKKGSDVASAATVTLGDGEFFHITGTTGITDIDFTTSWNGRTALLVFDGILTITHNATTLICPGGADLTTRAGDVAIVRVESGDNVRIVAFFRADGSSQALEKDATNIYATTDAGNKGFIPVKHLIRCNATRTLPNDTNLNPIFNSPANGRITLEVGTYMFEGMIYITAMSATSGNALINIRGAGTATIGGWLWRHSGIDNTTPTTPAAHSGAFNITEATAASLVTAGTGTALAIEFHGTFEVTVAGTLIPSIDLVTAAAGVVAIGSYFKCHRVGTDAVVSIGQWD